MVEIATSIYIENEKVFQDALDRASKEISDFRIPFGSISRAWYQSNKMIFNLKSAGKYEDLSTKPFFAWWEKDDDLRREYEDGYKEYKQAKYGHVYPIHLATGRLASSMLSPSDRDAWNLITRDQLEMGTLVPYAIFHQSDKTPRKKIPQRKMIFISGGPADDAKDASAGGRLKRWVGIVDDYTEQVLQKRMGQ